MTSRQNEGQGADSTIRWFRFPDGGSYVGPVCYGLAQGLAVSVGSRGIGEFSGVYHGGYETLGVLRAVNAESNGQARSESNNYAGEWSDGRRHGLGVDSRDGWVFRGEWTQGFRGRYGVRHKLESPAGYEGTWTSGVQDGFGVEIYADGGTYCGQWMKGMRHGYGIRQSSSYNSASKYRAASPTSPLPVNSQSKRSTLLQNPADSLVSLRDQRVLTGRGGFVLLADTSFPALPRKRGLLIDRHGRPSLSKTISHQFKIRGISSGNFSRSSSFRSVGSRSSGGSVRSALAPDDVSEYSDDDAASFISQDITSMSVTALKEIYRGEWKHDRRNGYGVCERTDGLRYEGEWVNNQKHGYGCTTLPGGNKISGKYRNNVLITSATTKGVLAPFQGNKILDRVAFAVEESVRAARHAVEKEEIAKIRMKGARERAALADSTAARANIEAEAAKAQAGRIMSSHQSSTDVDISIHRPSEREFYLEVDPTDKDFSYLGSQTTKKKRFPLSLGGRPRTGSLSTDQQASDLRNFATNQPVLNRPHSHIETFTNSEYNNEPTLARFQVQNNQFQPPGVGVLPSSGVKALQPGVGAQPQPPTYTFETSHQATVNRLSSVPAYDHSDAYRPTDLGRTRRKSLPSIVKEKVVEEIPPMYCIGIDPDIPSVKKSAKVRTPSGKDFEIKQLTEPIKTVKRVDTYVIENGVKKLVTNTREAAMAKAQGSIPAATNAKPGGALSRLIQSSFNAASAAPRAHVSLEEQFKDMYKTESKEVAWKKGRGSNPDITAGLNVRIPPREEVYVLSQRRREEKILERAERERIQKNHIVLSFIDMKSWISQHLLFVCFMFINVLVAALLLKS